MGMGQDKLPALHTLLPCLTCPSLHAYLCCSCLATSCVIVLLALRVRTAMPTGTIGISTTTQRQSQARWLHPALRLVVMLVLLHLTCGYPTHWKSLTSTFTTSYHNHYLPRRRSSSSSSSLDSDCMPFSSWSPSMKSFMNLLPLLILSSSISTADASICLTVDPCFQGTQLSNLIVAEDGVVPLRSSALLESSPMMNPGSGEQKKQQDIGTSPSKQSKPQTAQQSPLSSAVSSKFGLPKVNTLQTSQSSMNQEMEEASTTAGAKVKNQQILKEPNEQPYKTVQPSSNAPLDEKEGNTGSNTVPKSFETSPGAKSPAIASNSRKENTPMDKDDAWLQDFRERSRLKKIVSDFKKNSLNVKTSTDPSVKKPKESSSVRDRKKETAWSSSKNNKPSRPDGKDKTKSTVADLRKQVRQNAPPVLKSVVEALQTVRVFDIVQEDSQLYIVIPSLGSRILYRELPLLTILQSEVLAGAAGELTKDLILHPIDTLKARAQAKKKDDDTDSEPTKNQNWLEIVLSLYSGCIPVFSTSALQGAAFFGINKTLKRYLAYNFGNSPYNFVLQDVIPPIVGTFSYWAVRTPPEVVKIKCQTGQSSNAAQALKAAIKEAGIVGLWKKYGIMLQLDIPFQIMNFILYDAMVGCGMESAFGAPVIGRLVIGTVSGMISAGLTTPLDVAKTRLVMRSRLHSDKVLLSDPHNFGQKIALAIEPPLSDNTTSTLLPSVVTPPPPMALTLAGTNTDELETDSATDMLVARECAPDESRDALLVDNAFVEVANILKEDGFGALFLGVVPRVLQIGLSNGIRFAGYGTTRELIIRRAFEKGF